VKRYILKKGDKSTNGGVVLEGIAGCILNGTPLTFIGARVWCNGCKSEGFIASKGPHRTATMMGKQQALEGDICVCRCTPAPIMLASQDTASHSFQTHELASQDSAGTSTSITSKNRRFYDECVRVIDKNGRPIASIPYHIRTPGGAVYKGLTDVSGHCPRVYTDNSSTLDIAIGMRALERWSDIF
jgi:uncharacterized Zn-binding protein involved in type VI secretion